MIGALFEFLLSPLNEPIARMAAKAKIKQDAREHIRRTERPWKAEADAYDKREKRRKAKKSADSKKKNDKPVKAKVKKMASSQAPKKTGRKVSQSKPSLSKKTLITESSHTVQVVQGKSRQSMAADEFFATYAVPCFYHFTDVRNIPLIRESGGLLSMRAMRDAGIPVPAPGGDANSQLSDSRNGMDRYVHLCLFNQNPMEYRARQDGRIEDSRFIEIDRDVLRIEGVRFTAAMANQAGVFPLSIEQAFAEMDFSAVYGNVDWKIPEQMQRVLAARKFELLIPDCVPLHYIKRF